MNISIMGTNARKLSEMDDVADQIGPNAEPADLDLTGLNVGLSLLTGLDCMAEHTGFPGAADEMKDGDEWGVWRYSYKKGVGSEDTYSFTSTL